MVAVFSFLAREEERNNEQRGLDIEKYQVSGVWCCFLSHSSWVVMWWPGGRPFLSRNAVHSPALSQASSRSYVSPNASDFSSVKCLTDVLSRLKVNTHIAMSVVLFLEWFLYLFLELSRRKQCVGHETLGVGCGKVWNGSRRGQCYGSAVLRHLAPAPLNHLEAIENSKELLFMWVTSVHVTALEINCGVVKTKTKTN